MAGISVVVPVGPHAIYKTFLGDCLDSIESQMTLDDEIVLVDDCAGLRNIKRWKEYIDNSPLCYWESPWLLGCASAWNIGVALARNNLCLLMGSDDKLLPGCLDALREEYEAQNHKDAYYNLTIQIGDDPEVHTVFNNAAAVTKGLWRMTGGFPLSSGIGAPDALLISIMMVHFPDRLLQVKERTPNYWCRVHDQQETQRQAGLFWSEVISVRDKETARFKPNPEWAQR